MNPYLQPQYTSFNPYMQQQQTGFNPFLQQQMQEQAALQAQWQQQQQQFELQQAAQQYQQLMMQQTAMPQQQQLRPQPTAFGSNNPFANFGGPSAQPQQQQQHNVPVGDLFGSEPTPAPQPQVQPQQAPVQQPQQPAGPPRVRVDQSNKYAELNNLLASGDGIDTFGNTGDMRCESDTASLLQEPCLTDFEPNHSRTWKPRTARRAADRAAGIRRSRRSCRWSSQWCKAGRPRRPTVL